MTTPQADDVTVVVLAGGESRRFGSDKLAAPLGGSTVLDHVVAGLPAAVARRRGGCCPTDRRP